jgi:peptidoglycan/LPS O-acetylase OafA/YrhL
MWLGGVSYGLYPWQQPFLNRGSSAPWAAFPVNLVLALLLAAASIYLVEQPCRSFARDYAQNAFPT